MSRICVKNLPKNLTEDRMREFFSQKGEVTDAKLMRTKDGRSRQFGYVGFRTEGEAAEAIKYFNKSYMNTSRITCEIACGVRDPDMPRPWSKYSLKKQEESTKEGKKTAGGESTGLANSKGKKRKNENDIEIDDPQLQEFLQVMQSRSKSKLWANDTVPATEQDGTAVDKQNRAKKKGKEKPTSALPESDGTGEREKDFLDGQENENLHNLGHDGVFSDMDYFRSRVKKEWSDSESEDRNSHDDPNVQKTINKKEAKNTSDEEVEDGSPNESDHEMIDSGNPSSSLKDDPEQILETGRLFVRNLPYTTNEDELEEHFSKFGSVAQAHIVVDRDTKRSKGIAYILYTLPESAARALTELDNSIFQGRLLHVMPAKQKNPLIKEERSVSVAQSFKTFKKQRVEERKASEASGNTRAWNTLFMRSDTVVENIARKFGVSKSVLLDRDADDIAVRIALGETQVIAETKKALANAGINIASLEDFAAGKIDGVKRSSHVILVKNLPYGASESELSSLFGKFGSLDKIILPPTKTLALVVFLEPSEARAAFKGLAYKRFKDSPLYLEWAPGNILSPYLTSSVVANGTVVDENAAKRALLEQQVEGILDVEVDPDRVESRSLFVKNLNFKTSDESLKKHFSDHMKEGKILSVRVKKHLKNGKYVSMGFGFIEFDSFDTATNVCKDLQGTVLDGHALILQLCHSKKDERVLKNGEKDKTSTKLIIRNVAFEATKKDLRQLFSPFGQIKRLRLPKKSDGKHRGFAFVEYITKQEAQNAVKSLSNTHLYGRHLVLEGAKEGESLEELRARTAAQFAEQNGFQNSSKKKKMKSTAVLDEGSLKFQRIAD